jgi:hypothetical protein
MKPNFTYAEVVYFVATLAATVTLTTHVGQWKRYGNEASKPAAQHTSAQASTIGADQRLNAAYRDGLYVGKLAQQRGEERQPSVGRWSTSVDRDAFSAGYSEANTQVVSAVDGN